MQSFTVDNKLKSSNIQGISQSNFQNSFNIFPWLFTLLPIFISLYFWYIQNLDRLIPLSLNSVIVQVFGILAFHTFAYILIISTRLPYIPKIFGSYDNTYFWHKFYGITAYAFLCIHAGAYSLRYINTESIGAYLTSYLSLQNWPITLGLFSMIGISVLMLLTFLPRIPYHIWKTIHNYMGLFVVTGSLHAFFVDSTISESPLLKAHFIFWAVLATLAFVYIRFLWKMVPFTYKYNISDKVTYNDVTDVFLTPSCSKDKFMEYTPGQFVFASFPNNSNISDEAHPYTISSAPHQTLRLSIKNLGDYTKNIQYLKIGDECTINGPYGNFAQNIRKVKGDVVFIGGGIGITPFLSIMNDLACTPSFNGHVNMLYLVNKSDEAVYDEELKTLSDKSNVNYFLYDTEKEQGFCNLSKTVDIFNLDLKNTHFYICGPKGMMNAFASQLVDAGVRKNKIHLEDFSFKN